MPLEAWITLAVVACTIALLASERVAPSLAMSAAVVVLLLAGVIDDSQALSGFSNPAPVTVAALYVLAGAAEITGALIPVTSLLLRHRGSDRLNLARLLFPTAAFSAFLNNTPLVAVVAPQVRGWARRTGRSPSRYLMPVSFAAILGGLVTLLGTSTNLVVSGLLEQSGRPGLSLFELARVGLPLAAAGLVLLVLLAPVLLPDRRAPGERLSEEAKEFTLEMVVSPGSPLAGSSVEEGGLRHLEGVFLVQVERDGRRIAPVGPDEVLAEGDRLTFVGNVNQILDLQRIRGITSAEEAHFDVEGGDQRFYEVVVGTHSPIVGRTLKEVGFRARYGAAVVAIHRAGARVPSKLGRVTLRAGDVLIVLADPGFRRRWRDRQDFLVVAPLDGATPLRSKKAPLVGLVALLLVVVAGSGLLPILHASMAAAVVLVTLGVISPHEARQSLDLDVLLLIAASFGLGQAIATSGLADQLGNLLTHLASSLGDVWAVIGVLLVTILLTELISNNAAAALMFPIAIATATSAGLNPRAFAVAVAIGASADFLTPIGYQTNTMVYGMGGYRFGDFWRLGLPLTLTALAVASVAIPIGWPLR